jgi:hypothetical protein
MGKSRALVATLVGILALAAVLATPAFAEFSLLAEWLISGAAVTASTAVETTGEFRLEDSKLAAGAICSAVLVGTVGPNGEDQTTEVLSAVGVLVTLTAPLLCRPSKGCELSATDIEASPEGLPFSSLLYLSEFGSFLDVTIKASYSLSCFVLGIKVAEECTLSDGVDEVVNSSFSVEAIGELIPPGNCTVGGAGSGDIEPLTGNNMRPRFSGTLAVSE